MTNLSVNANKWVKVSKMGQQNEDGQNNGHQRQQTSHSHSQSGPTPLSVTPFASLIYGGDRSPASPEAQACVDQLIDYVNGQIEMLAFENPDPLVLRQMVQCLIDPRRSTRLSLVESFSQIGEPATPFLLEGVAHHAEPVVRRACCNALTNIGDPDSVPVLVESLLKDPDIGVKSAAAGALAKVGAPAFDALRDMLASDEVSESCKGHAAWAMASMSSEVSERLYRMMSDPSAAVRTAVIGAIAQFIQTKTAQQAEPVPLTVGQPHQGHLQAVTAKTTEAKMARPETLQRALTMLTEALNDQSSEVRIEAAANLARLGCQKAYQPLIACLKDPAASVRKAAALALAKLGNPEAIEAISLLLRDAEETVQRTATVAIDQLKSGKAVQNIKPKT